MPVSSLEELEEKDVEGGKVAVGFRPSGSLHVGNLLTITYAAVLADELGKDLDLMVCDTDWSAHIHEHHLPDENRVMKLFFKRGCPCGNHDSIAEHRLDELSSFLDVLAEETVEFEPGFLSDYEDESYDRALENVLDSVDELNDVFGGRFRDRYRSPVAAVCPECGFSDAKGSAYSSETGMLVSACHNPECSTGFMETRLSDSEKGVYYLVDPVRDPGRDVALHVFGGDYRDAGKGEKTPNVEKVEKITKMACGETPVYFLSPMIGDDDGNPLSKSHETGVTVDEINDIEEFAKRLVEKVRKIIDEKNDYVVQDELLG
jgi:lysyl-tRNA synthetase class I